MLELAVTPSRSGEEPPVGLDQLDNLPNLHAHGLAKRLRGSNLSLSEVSPAWDKTRGGGTRHYRERKENEAETKGA